MGAESEDAPLRIHPLTVTLARVAAAGGSASSATVVASIINPSRRLSCSFRVGFEPAAGSSIPASYGSSTWTVRAVSPNRITRGKADMHLIRDTEVLPEGYEIDSAVRELRVSCVLGLPLDAAAATIAGQWVLYCEWEPNQPAMCEPEIIDLFARCGLVAPGATVLLS